MADQPKPLAWATIYSQLGREDMVEVGPANPERERQAETWGWSHRRVPLVELPSDQLLVPVALLKDIEMTWRLWDRHAKPFNELGERKVIEGLEELRSLLQRATKA